MSVFFISDTHFSHANIIRLGQGRPFNTIRHHDETLRANWNSVVGPDDVVWHLGDAAMGPIEDSLKFMEGLNGHKVLVVGNHDRLFSKSKNNPARQKRELYERVFTNIVDHTTVIRVAGRDVRLCHFPYSDRTENGHHYTDKNVDMYPEDDGMPIIHGHTHQAEQFTVTRRGTPQMSVGVDAWNFTPVSESVVQGWLNIA